MQCTESLFIGYASLVGHRSALTCDLEKAKSFACCQLILQSRYSLWKDSDDAELLRAWASCFSSFPSLALQWVLEGQSRGSSDWRFLLSVNQELSDHQSCHCSVLRVRVSGGQLQHQIDTAAGRRVCMFILFFFYVVSYFFHIVYKVITLSPFCELHNPTSLSNVCDEWKCL